MIPSKYFVLKPDTDSDDIVKRAHAHASRKAMLVYADAIASTDIYLARALRKWVDAAVNGIPESKRQP